MLVKSLKMSLLGILAAARTKMRVFLTNLALNFVVYNLLISLLPGQFTDKSLGYLYAYLITNGLMLVVYVFYFTVINWHE